MRGIETQIGNALIKNKKNIMNHIKKTKNTTKQKRKKALDYYYRKKAEKAKQIESEVSVL